jgi:autotransporter-associated beta strand protein
MKGRFKGCGYVLAVITTLSAAANGQTWKGVSPDAAWSNPANWDPAPPASGSATQLTFDLSSPDSSYTPTNDLPGTFVLNRVTLTGSGDRQIAGNPLQFTANASILPELNLTGSAFNATLATPVTLANDTTVRIAPSRGRINLTGALGGAGMLTVAGTGTSSSTYSELTLTGSNTYTGGTRITGGSLTAAAPHTLGTGPVDASAGRLVVPAGATNALTGSNALSVSGGFVDLSAANDYTGGTTIPDDGSPVFSFGARAIHVAADNALGTGPVFLNDGSVQLENVTLPNAVHLTTNSVIFINNTRAEIGSLTGSGPVTRFPIRPTPAVTITHDLAPAGQSPGQPGTLTFGDIGPVLDPNLVDLVLTPTSAVRIDLTGPGASDIVQVSNLATLDGNLVISFAPGYVPAIGSTFDVLTYASRTGTFDAVTSDIAGADFTAQYLPDRVRIRVNAVPEPAALCTLLSTACAGLLHRPPRRPSARTRT